MRVRELRRIFKKSMKLSDEPMRLGRCILAGLFAGIITAVIVLVFNVIYREHTHLYTYAVVMPLTIFMAFPVADLVAGGVYFLFVTHLRKGRAIFTLVVLLVTALIVLITALTGSATNEEEKAFRGLLVGLEIIEGVLAAFLIPFFANHPTLYLTDNDIRGEA